MLLRPRLLGSSPEENLEKLEGIFQEYGLDTEAELKALQTPPVLPDDPRTPDSLRTVQDRAEELDRLEAGIADDDPEAAEKRELLGKARRRAGQAQDPGAKGGAVEGPPDPGAIGKLGHQKQKIEK